uniref:Cobaltochelatase CobT subunit n=1 Tax=Candidatus Kentrum sp. MB TaxID=2138164 RepID=A0A450XNI8_9GAMM|nr:MAG: cobaltochelatase CobT subunit [Candidatus Kentron sp. MB]VFK75254.1 MAG: cobaltochelatase CobT subunit [Candidatus Kentron sp. MB]
MASWKNDGQRRRAHSWRCRMDGYGCRVAFFLWPAACLSSRVCHPGRILSQTDLRIQVRVDVRKPDSSCEDERKINKTSHLWFVPLETKTEQLRRVTAATCRAIAGRRDIELSFEADETVYLSTKIYSIASHNEAPLLEEKEAASATRVCIHPPSAVPHPREIARVRGEADTAALRFAYHDAALHERLAPLDVSARMLFDALEEVRYEALGARRMMGVALNLSNAWEERCLSLPLDSGLREPGRLSEAMRLVVRRALEGSPPPDSARGFVRLWDDYLLPEIGEMLPELSRTLHDQHAFSLVSRGILMALGFAIENRTRKDVRAELKRKEEEGGEGAVEQDRTRSGPGELPPETPPLDSVDALDGSTEDPGISETARDEPESALEYGEQDRTKELKDYARRGFPDHEAGKGYRVYVADFDEVVEPSEICEGQELVRLRLKLDRELALLHRIIGRLANRLQRRLLARQARSWAFDQEEGLLDAARLARIVANPANSLSYKQEQETPFRDTVVTLLIDNSGSMRGRPITLAAISVDVLARTLERCGVKTEILGFTTRTWKGGRARERWIEAGGKPNPGRLNELRHIVYKSADTPWRRARKNLGLMLREGLLKENVDGESLLWAHQRLLGRHEERRILMVISDGTPVDDATLLANTDDYLDRHLRQVIEYIERESSVELLAIGMRHDVAEYYHRAVTLVDAEQLGGTMMEELANLFDNNSPNKYVRKSGHRRGFGTIEQR